MMQQNLFFHGNYWHIQEKVLILPVDNNHGNKEKRASRLGAPPSTATAAGIGGGVGLFLRGARIYR